MRITPANVHDKTASFGLFEQVESLMNTVKLVVADQGYKGDDLPLMLLEKFGCKIELTKKLGDGFIPAPFRWVIERTFAWLTFARRLSKNYERTLWSLQSWISLQMSDLILSRLS